MNNFKKILQPYHILVVVLSYCLGVGIANYLGSVIDWIRFSLGLFAVLLLPIAAQLLIEYFSIPFKILELGETRSQREIWRVQILQVTFALLVLSTASIVALILMGSIALTATLLYALICILLILYSIPPFQFYAKGYGEFVLALIYATIVPAFAYLLQREEITRILLLTSFPLTLLGISWLLSADFFSYSQDQKMGRVNLLIRLTWQRAVPFHHVLVLLSFLLLSASPFFGLSWAILWPVFLAMPFFLLEILWLQRIAGGGNPVWKFFNHLSPAVYLLVLYLLTMSFWLR